MSSRMAACRSQLAHRWACQLCEVVAYLHAQTPPILHCDITPHNIMITGQGTSA